MQNLENFIFWKSRNLLDHPLVDLLGLNNKSNEIKYLIQAKRQNVESFCRSICL